MYLRWIASLVNYILVAIFLWCNVSSLHCIFGVMYMHFWYAMHRQLCWCLVGVITIVQCIFGALFLGLGCNIFLVLRLWCYALSAISRRLATAVAHLLYILIIQNANRQMSSLDCIAPLTPGDILPKACRGSRWDEGRDDRNHETFQKQLRSG